MARAAGLVLAALLLVQPPRDSSPAHSDTPFATGTIRGRVVSAATGDPIVNAEGFGEWQDPAVLESLAPSASRIVLAESQRVSLAARLIVR